MAKYLLIESRDPFDSNDVAQYYALASSLAGEVLPARPGIHSAALEALADSGVEILADDFSLRERGIAADGLAPGVRAAALDVVIDQLADGRKAIWH
jgi:intracellular sulfur oxidation DsrE/DsrF family protein